jgi:hypothetical protein
MQGLEFRMLKLTNLQQEIELRTTVTIIIKAHFEIVQ